MNMTTATAITPQYRKKPVVVSASQWLKNGDHPLDYSQTHDGFENGELRKFSPEERRANGWEGDIVRYFRTPDDSGARACEHCGKTMHFHGWIDTKEGGHIVCPGDWIITGVQGEHYPCKPDIFAASYEPAAAHPDLITIALDPDPRGVSVGVWQGARCIYNGVHPLPAIPGVSTVEDAQDERQAFEAWADEQGFVLDCDFFEVSGQYYDNDDTQLAYDIWRAARASAPAAGDTRALPPLDDDLIEILGRPNFACAELATLLRAGGHTIENKAEREQAAVIHFLLEHYLKHGADWHERVGAAFEAIAAQRQGDAA